MFFKKKKTDPYQPSIVKDFCSKFPENLKELKDLDRYHCSHTCGIKGNFNFVLHLYSKRKDGSYFLTCYYSPTYGTKTVAAEAIGNLLKFLLDAFNPRC